MVGWGDARVVATTSMELEEAMAAGHLRGDLFHRLNQVSLRLPPLRERNGDVEHLVRYFLANAGEGGRTPTIDADALAALCAHPWPGNIRQRQNELLRALALGDGERLTRAALSPEVTA